MDAGTDPGARLSDPLGSHEAVAQIVRWSSLRDAIMDTARLFDPIPFDDGDLTEHINHVRSTPVQRNVVARARGLLEREGKLVRIGNRRRAGKATMHFRLPDNDTRAAQPAPAVPLSPHARACYTEVSGIMWCATHDDFAIEGYDWSDICHWQYHDGECNDDDTEWLTPCDLRPLYAQQ